MQTFDQILAVDITQVPVMSRDRSIPRKEQAALARQLMKRLGIKGVSITTPNYSMAQSVDVCLPSEPPADMTGYEQYQYSSFADMPDDVPIKAREVRRNIARNKLDLILEAAFPQHDNRSDYQSDHFDYCWSNH